jgi:hypothetical protein
MAMIMQLGQTEPIAKSFGQDVNGNLVPNYKVLVNKDPVDAGTVSGPLNIVLAFMKNFSDTQKDTYN